MPLTNDGKKTLENLKREYGDKKGEEVFYAMMNSGKLDRGKMEHKTEKKSDLTNIPSLTPASLIDKLNRSN